MICTGCDKEVSTECARCVAAELSGTIQELEAEVNQLRGSIRHHLKFMTRSSLEQLMRALDAETMTVR